MNLQEAVNRLILWDAAVRRDLPWRADPTPYHIWISEIMLQQTRVEAVIPYYQRFLFALPDVPSLAQVDQERLFKLWEGLGYYSRARNLRLAAQMLVKYHGGALPASAELLRTLPGIGEYTAGAIASLAFGLPEPAVDGNVLRVMSRLLAYGEDVLTPKAHRHITALLREVYPTGREAGLLTEGFMELGQTLCLPRTKPDCAQCPLHDLCEAHAQGIEPDLPIRPAPKPRRIEERTVFLFHCNHRYALRRRPNRGLLAGLWEFPTLPGHIDPYEIFPDAGAYTYLGEAKHLFTHVEWHMIGWKVEVREELGSYTWLTREEIEKACPIPSALRFYAQKM